MKPLEALKELVVWANNPYLSLVEDSDEEKSLVKPIEDALKRLEKIDKEREKEIDEAMAKRLEELNTPGQIIVDYSNMKKDNALSILLNKDVNIRYMRYCMSKRKGLRYYNASRYGEEQLTYDEWELLKDVMDNNKKPHK